MFKKITFSVISLVLLTLAFQIPAFATTVTISISGNRGVIDISASATFPVDPVTGRSGGSVIITRNGLYFFGANPSGPTWSYYEKFDSPSLLDGTHTFTITATAWDGSSSSASQTIVTNNAPIIDVASPSAGPVRGVIDLIIGYSFPSSLSTQSYTALEFSVDEGELSGAVKWLSLNPNSETQGTWKYTIDTCMWPDGAHTIKITARTIGPNVVTQTISVESNSTPILQIISPQGIVRGVIDFNLYYSFAKTIATGTYIDLWLDSSRYRSYRVTLNPLSEIQGNWQFKIDTTQWRDGSYTLKARTRIGVQQAIAISNIFVANRTPIIPHPKEVPLEKTTQVAEPINVATGNMFISQTDIIIPSREIPLELSRTYNSQDDFAGSFGYGWRSNFDITLTEQPDHSVIEVDEKGVYTIYTKNPDGTYKPSAGKYSQLTKNSDGTFILLRKHGRKLYFDTQGRLIKIEERNGNTLNILRTPDGVISEVSDSSDRKLLFTQDAQGRIIQVEDPKGRIFKYEYDSNGNLIKTTNPLNNQTLYQYDSNHNLIQQTDANGHSLYFEYDSSDRAFHSWQDNNNNEVTLSFDPINKTTIVTDSLGNLTKYEYNDYGLVTKITDSQNNIQTFSWDSNLNKTSATDKNGNTTTFTYDSRGNLLSIKDPLNITTTFTYEPNFNLVSSITDALGNRTEYVYDVKGNLVRIEDALGSTTNYSYDTQGQLIQTEDANGNITNFNYDSYGNLIQITDALNNQTIFTYDIIGNLTQITDAKGNSTQFSYDPLNQLIQITYPDNSKVSYAYDAVGNLTSFIDPNNYTTTYTYDVVNRLIQVTDALGNITQYTYDTEGNCLSIIDANLNKTQYLYDSLNRLIKTIDPLNNQTFFNYDPAGNLISKTDANTNTINYTYDKNNRLTQITYPDGSKVSFTYDALGRQISMTDSTGITTYSYDALSRLTRVDGPQANDTISYAYDKLGNRIQMINQDGGITSYTYDSLNRLVSLTDPQGRTTIYSYDSVSNLVQMSYPNHTQTHYTFDNLNRLVSLTNKAGAKTISTYTYEYNPSGMRTKVILEDKSYIEYDYDALNRLIREAKYNRYGYLRYSYEYSFDAVGNRLTMKQIPPKHTFWRNWRRYLEKDLRGNIKEETKCYSPAMPKPAILTKYTYNESNQLILDEKGLEWKNKFIPLAKTEYLYDHNGNQVEKRILKTHGSRQAEKTTYDYDYENRLIKIVYPDFNKEQHKGLGGKPATSEYEYDGLGRRIKAVEDEDVTFYLYDGLNVIIERDQTNQTLVTYTRGLSYGGGIGSIISSTRSRRWKDIADKTFTTYYHYDGLGSVTNLTSSKGHKIAGYEYDAYGNILKQTGLAKVNLYRFSTKEYSPESGLIYFGARYYEPKVGRWITRDPLTWGPDDPRSYINLPNLPARIQNLIILNKGIFNSDKIMNVNNLFVWLRSQTILQVGQLNPSLYNQYVYCLNNPINLVDTFGLKPDESFISPNWPGYIDVNITLGYFGGVTFGWLNTNSGTYFYVGGGFVYPGVSVSITYSPSTVTPGWTVGISGTGGIAGQIGYSFGKGGGGFWELGGGWPPGGNVVVYYIFDKK